MGGPYSYEPHQPSFRPNQIDRPLAPSSLNPTISRLFQPKNPKLAPERFSRGKEAKSFYVEPWKSGHLLSPPLLACEESVTSGGIHLISLNREWHSVPGAPGQKPPTQRLQTQRLKTQS